MQPRALPPSDMVFRVLALARPGMSEAMSVHMAEPKA